MKKFLTAMLAALMVISMFTACGDINPEDMIKNFLSSKINESLEDSESESSKSEEKESSSSEKSEPKDSKSGNNIDLPSNLLTNNFINTVKGGKYYINYTGVISAEGESYDAEFFTAVSGDTVATKTIMKMNNIKITTRVLNKGNKAYLIYDDTKSYTTLSTDDNQLENNFEYDDIVYVKSGTETLDGKNLKFEEFKASDIPTRYYYDGSKLYAIVVKNEESEFKMIIKEISNNIPAGLLDLPSGYKESDMPALAGISLPSDVSLPSDLADIDDFIKNLP